MDVSFAINAVTELLADWPEAAGHGPDTANARALWISGLVSHARCFRGGVRTAGGAPDAVRALSESNKERHEYFLNLRDKHIAHSVNAFEQAKVAVGLG